MACCKSNLPVLWLSRPKGVKWAACSLTQLRTCLLLAPPSWVGTYTLRRRRERCWRSFPHLECCWPREVGQVACPPCPLAPCMAASARSSWAWCHRARPTREGHLAQWSTRGNSALQLSDGLCDGTIQRLGLFVCQFLSYWTTLDQESFENIAKLISCHL